MTSIRTRIPLALAAFSLTCLPAWADTIRKTDGKSIEDVKIEAETLIEVTYKEGNKNGSVPADQVLAIEYAKMPDQMDEAEAYAADEDYGSAEALLDDYVNGHLAGNTERRFKWAPARAAWRVVELRMAMGDLGGAIESVDRLVGNFPDSRFVPLAYTTKADALVWQGNDREAQKTLETFQKLIEAQSLSRRWDLECQLALVRTNADLSGEARRDKLVVIQNLAGGEYPSVKNRAKVGVGESFVDEAIRERNGPAQLELVGLARAVFEQIIEEFQGEDETMAGAFTGLGDCLYMEGVAKGNDAALLGEGLMQYLRVVVLYKDQTRYQAKSLCFAGRCYQLMGGEEDLARARQLYSRVIRDYPDSPWATQARTFQG